ncbi:MAG: hypothetical protein U0R50_06505 [Gaiellales bacterium]
MRHLTVRNVSDELSAALQEEKRTRGRSLNQVVLDLLEQAVGLDRRRTNGLASLAGAWSADEQAAFERAVAETERIDEELWR